jgi:signal transduction histidine kinase/ActR/RegA family two-component response regulator
LWRILWGLCILLGIGLFIFYSLLPVDGATGDLESFTPAGFQVQWILEERPGGLQQGDLILSAGGATAEQWLNGTAKGPGWDQGEVITYHILREGMVKTVSIQLEPIPLGRILIRWAPQLLASLGLLFVGSYIFWKRPSNLTARLIMLCCMMVALQLWIDAYNFQFAILTQRWYYGLHFILEQGTFAIACVSACHFALIFPSPHPLIERHPVAAPLLLYILSPLIVAVTVGLSPSWSLALSRSNRAILIGALVVFGLALAAGARSVRTTRDAVSRAQIRWILWGASVGLAVAIPGYFVPILLVGRPWIPHPILMLLTACIPYIYAIAVFRYQLFEIDTIINRTLVYGIVTILLVGLYLLLVRVLTLAVQTLLNREHDTVVVFIATLTIAWLFFPLRQRVQALIDRGFYRSKINYQQLLGEMGARLSSSIVFEELNSLLSDELAHRLQIESATLAILDPTGEQFVVADREGNRPFLPVDHSLPTFLSQQAKPVLRLEPPPDLPVELQILFEQQRIEASVPLIIRGKLIGLYNLGPKRSGIPYRREQVRFLQLLGQQAAVAVENCRLLQAAKHQAEKLAMLHRVATAVSSSLELDEIVVSLAKQLGQALRVDGSHIYSFDENKGQSTSLAEWFSTEDDGWTEIASDLNRTFDLQERPCFYPAIKGKHPLVLHTSDPDLDPAIREAAIRRGWRSCLIVPLISRDRVIGFARLETRAKRIFSEEEIRLCQTLAADTAVAIEHARLFQAEREQRELAEALEEAAATVSSTLNLDQVLDRILEQVERVVDGDAFNIMLKEGESCRIVRWRGYESLGVADQVAGLSMPITRYPTLHRMAQTNQPVVVPNIEETDYWVNLPGWEWLKAYIGAPIRISDRIVGFLNVDSSREGEFDPADGRRLLAFADHAAAAIQNARLFEEARLRTAHLEAHNAVIAAAAIATDLRELLKLVLKHTVQALDLDSGNIRVDARHVNQNTAPEVAPLVAETVYGIMKDTTGAIAVDDWQQLLTGSPWSSASSTMVYCGIRASLTVPITTEGQHVGELTLTSPRPRRWTSEEIDLIRAIGRQLGGAAERLRLVEKMQEQTQQVQVILSTIPEGMLLLSSDWRVLLANPTAERYLEILAAARVGDILTHLGGQPITQFLVKSHGGMGHEITDPGPPARVFEVTAQAIEKELEEGWVLLIREITHKRESERQMQQQARLAALGQLAGGIAHDFNNVLMTILLSAQIILSEPDLLPDIVANLNSILTEAQKATHLVRQILDFSRRSWLETRPLNLPSFIEETAAILKRTLPETIQLQLDVTPGEYYVNIDPTRMQQVIMNLAVNARDAMPYGGELCIGLNPIQLAPGQEPPLAEMPAGDWACLLVADTGSGMSPETTEHLFEPFFTTKPVGEGTGLGLAQVYGIVKQHQGYIDVDTSLGRGTTFRIYLPTHRGEEFVQVAPPQRNLDAPKGRGETVLVAEDEANVRKLCRTILESLGYRVLTAVNGRDALQVYQEAGRVDLVLTDLVMPEMGGRELVRELYKEDPQIKALVITGYALGEEMDSLHQDGIIDVIQKPIDLNALAQLVRRALDDDRPSF